MSGLGVRVGQPACRWRKSVGASLLREVLVAVVFAGLLPSAVSAQTAADAGPAESVPSRFRITGKVVDSITGSPVARARVSISPMNGRRGNGRSTGRAGGQGSVARFGDQAASETTGAKGEFSIRVPSAGGWRVIVSAHGYHTQAFEEHDGFSTAIVLTDAEPVYQMTFPLPPGAAIEGYVLDEAGEAVRNGQLALSLLRPPTPDDRAPRPQQRGSQQTDDRGYFKFSGLSPGAYQLRLQAQPWYATSAGPFGGIGGFNGIGVVAGGISSGGFTNQGASQGAPTPDPLDVAYPVLWYPGTADYSAAAPITLSAGETREADFRLSPIPAYHLRLANPAPLGTDARGRALQGIQAGVYLNQVFLDGTESVVPASTRVDAEGNQELSGLAPGTYVVHRQGERGPAGASETTLQISFNSPRTVDLSQATATTRVTVRIDPADDSRQMQVVFRDVATGRVVYAQRPREVHRDSRRGSASLPDAGATEKEDGTDGEDRIISLDAGRYEVSLTDGSDLHLTGIDATGAEATGRTVTIAGGTPELVLHVAHGRANVTGFVRFQGRADAGAMVLLVPVTLGDPAGLNIIRRDQSNSDGSFDLNGVLPGAYILVAIDHGWDVKWSDPATLRHYLMQGLPLDLTLGPGKPRDVRETVEAQAP